MDTPNASRVSVQSVKTHRDARGSLFEPLTDAELAGQKNVHVVLTQPNEVRGNHVHRTAVETTSVVGPCLIRLKEDGHDPRPRGAGGGDLAADHTARCGACVSQYRRFDDGAGVIQHQSA